MRQFFKRLATVFCCLIVFSPFNFAEAGFFRNLVNTIVSTVVGLPAPSNFVVRTLNQAVSLFTDCSESSVDGIRTHCLDGNEKGKVSAAVEILKSRNFLIDRGGATDPYYHYKNHTSNLVNWDSAQMRNTYILGYAAGCNTSANTWGCHSVDGTTFITGAGFALDTVQISGLLLHEGDHFNKSHTCGDTADNSLDGPYGLEALYLMSLYKNPTHLMTSGQASIAYSRSANIANYQLCGRTDLRDRVLYYSNSVSYYTQPLNVYYPPPYTPPSNCPLCSEP